MRRLISCVRPPTLPRTDSRSVRSAVARGSIEYSAVTQPRPLSLRQRGTPEVNVAVHMTRVLPHSMSTEPSGTSVKLRVIFTGRSSSTARPSGRMIVWPSSMSLISTVLGVLSWCAHGGAPVVLLFAG